MTSDRHVGESGGGTAGRPYKIIGAAALVVALGVIVVWLKVVQGGEDLSATRATFVARRGPLTISVPVSGAMKAKDPDIIRNAVEGRNSITYLIPEGSRVQKDDLLMVLDVSTLTDLKIDQEITVKNAEALYINAKETLTITTSQAQSDVDLATLKMEFAKQDLDKYVKGQYPNDRQAALGRIRLNEEELTRAKDTLSWSKRLFEEKYLSLTQLQADQLAQSRAQVNLEVVKNDANLLREYTYQRQMAQLTSDVEQTTMALERAQAKARANLAQAKADLEAREQEYNRKVARLDKINDQLTKSRIYASVDGMVQYATSSRGRGFRDDQRPLAEGVTVFERQELFYLSRSTSTLAEVDVYEANLDKVHAGLPAVVTVDAVPGKRFVGTVARIAMMPDALRAFLNPNLKAYKTDIALAGEDPALRSGMSCRAEIFVEHYEDVVYIPVQAVVWAGGSATVHVLRDGRVEPREVEVGLDNGSMIKISKGLREGEAVLLTPPTKTAALESGADANDTTSRRINEKLQAGNGSGGPANAGGPPPAGQSVTPGPGTTEGAAAPTQNPALGSPGQGFPSLTPEQAEQMRKRFESMTPEQRQEMEKMRERFQNMTPEEREQMRQRFRGSGGPGAGGRNRPDQNQERGRDSDDQRRGDDQGPGAAAGRESAGNP